MAGSVPETGKRVRFPIARDSGHNVLRNVQGHARTITAHKVEVTRLCFLCGLPKQGLLHDLSKYTPAEFITGVRYYQGTRSPNSAEREEKGYCEAWLHHKGRNRHHFEYWVDFTSRDGGKALCAPMPTRYVVEMFCDRVAASKVYQGADYTDESALQYYLNVSGAAFMHRDTAALLERLLRMLAEKGEGETLRYIRREIVSRRLVYAENARF